MSTPVPSGQSSPGAQPPVGANLPAPPLPGTNPTSTSIDFPGQESTLTKHQAQVSIETILDYLEERLAAVANECEAIRGQFSTIRAIIRKHE